MPSMSTLLASVGLEKQEDGKEMSLQHHPNYMYFHVNHSPVAMIVVPVV